MFLVTREIAHVESAKTALKATTEIFVNAGAPAVGMMAKTWNAEVRTVEDLGLTLFFVILNFLLLAWLVAEILL